MKSIHQNIKIVVLGLAVAVGLSYAFAWTGPQSGTIPPDNNVAAPINVGASYQTKAGGIALLGQGLATGSSTLDITGNLFADSILTYAFTLTDANSSPTKQNCAIGSTGCENGYVLMNDGSGNAVWVATSSLGMGGNVTNITTINNDFTHHQLYGVGTHTWTVPPGITSIEVGIWSSGGGGGGQASSGYGSGGNSGDSAPAQGGTKSGTFTVAPGDTISINVGAGGQAGQDSNNTCANSYNSTGYGGQATFIKKAGVTLVTDYGGGSGGWCTSDKTQIPGKIASSILYGFGPYGNGGNGAPGGDTTPCSNGWCTITASNGSPGEAIIVY